MDILNIMLLYEVCLFDTPKSFMGIMNSIFRPLLDMFIVVFIDDILVYFNDVEDHKSHLRIGNILSHVMSREDHKSHLRIGSTLCHVISREDHRSINCSPNSTNVSFG